MNVANIVDRLAALDHELGRLEARRALAQSNANTSELSRLEAEIDQVRKTRDALRPAEDLGDGTGPHTVTLDSQLASSATYPAARQDPSQ